MTTRATPKKKLPVQGKRIFLSFAREDHKLALILYKLLTTLAESDALIFKADALGSGIVPGSDWRKTLLIELQTAKALVGLVTPRSIVSRWLWIEGGIVWARDPEIVRLFLTPDIIPSQIIPFDHIQAQILRKELRSHVRKALEDVVRLVGVVPTWSSIATRLLRELLSAAVPVTNPTPTSSTNAASARRTDHDRDESTLRRLLLNLPTSVMDRFLEDLRGRYILEEIFYYFEGFRGIVTASDFHIFDETLRQRIERFLTAWVRSLGFSNHVVAMPGGKRFRLPTAVELGSDNRWTRLIAEFDNRANEASQTYLDLIAHVKEAYPAIDLAEATAKALRSRNDYYAERSDLEVALSQTQPSRTRSARRGATSARPKSISPRKSRT